MFSCCGIAMILCLYCNVCMHQFVFFDNKCLCNHGCLFIGIRITKYGFCFCCWFLLFWFVNNRSKSFMLNHRVCYNVRLLFLLFEIFSILFVLFGFFARQWFYYWNGLDDKPAVNFCYCKRLIVNLTCWLQRLELITR